MFIPIFFGDIFPTERKPSPPPDDLERKKQERKELLIDNARKLFRQIKWFNEFSDAFLGHQGDYWVEHQEELSGLFKDFLEKNVDSDWKEVFLDSLSNGLVGYFSEIGRCIREYQEEIAENKTLLDELFGQVNFAASFSDLEVSLEEMRRNSTGIAVALKEYDRTNDFLEDLKDARENPYDIK